MKLPLHRLIGRQGAVLRNTAYNLAGLGLPAVVAVVAIPPLIHRLGDEKFGILTIIWAVVSYFGLFDLGLGRAVTQLISTALARGREDEVRSIAGTGSAMMALLGLVGGAVMLALAPLLSREFAAPADLAEVTSALVWMGVAIPAIVMTSCYRGVLEAYERFGLLNAIRLPMGIYTFVAPLAVVASVGPRLDHIAVALALGRILACGVHAIYAVSAIPGRGHGAIDRSLLPVLLQAGGWLTASNIVAPLMNYVDRFILGFLASSSAVAYYATPQELLLRIGIIPSALATALFPLFAREASRRDSDRDRSRVRHYSAFVAMLMLPFSAVLFVFSEAILSVWIDANFAMQAGPVLKIMAIAALINGVAQIPYTMLQGMGRADLTGKLHIVELPLYLALLFVLAGLYGPIGAAWAWLIRIAGDMAMLYLLNRQSLMSHVVSPRASNGGVRTR